MHGYKENLLGAALAFFLATLVLSLGTLREEINNNGREGHAGMLNRLANEFLKTEWESLPFFRDAIDYVIGPADSSVFVLSKPATITKLGREGDFRFTVNCHGQGHGRVLRPNGIRIDTDILYISDPVQNKIVSYTTDGFPLYEIRPEHIEIRSFDVLDDRKLVIADLNANRGDAGLLNIYDIYGMKIASYGDKRVVLDRLKGAQGLPGFKIQKAHDGNLLLGNPASGQFFLFESYSGSLLNYFTLRIGGGAGE